jgi:MATE family multidrug resistance protein
VQRVAASLLLLVAGYHVFDALQAVTVNALRGYKRATVPLAINALGMWLVGLAGGYVIALTNIVERLPFGLVTPLGARGFWIGAIFGMATATLGIIAYFLAVRRPPGRACALRRRRPDASRGIHVVIPIPSARRAATAPCGSCAASGGSRAGRPAHAASR